MVIVIAHAPPPRLHTVTHPTGTRVCNLGLNLSLFCGRGHGALSARQRPPGARADRRHSSTHPPPRTHPGPQALHLHRAAGAAAAGLAHGLREPASGWIRLPGLPGCVEETGLTPLLRAATWLLTQSRVMEGVLQTKGDPFLCWRAPPCSQSTLKSVRVHGSPSSESAGPGCVPEG